MQYTVLPFKGYQSMRALNAYSALLLGLKMLPAYVGYDYPTFFEEFEKKSDADKEMLIREAVAFVELERNEIEAMVSFVPDPNGVPYRKENIGNLKPEEIFEMIVQVALAFSKVEINLITDAEKKSLRTSQ